MALHSPSAFDWQIHVFIICVILSCWHALVSVAMLLKLCIFAPKDYKETLENNRNPQILRNLALSMNIFFCIAFGIGSISSIYKWGSTQWFIFQILKSIFFCLAMVSLCGYFIHRLKMTFEGSVYAVSKLTLTIYYVLSIAIFGFMFAGFMVVAIWPYKIIYFVGLLSISILILMITSLHVTALFNKKLFKLVLSRWQEVDSYGNIARRRTMDLSRNDLNIIEATTKQSLIHTVGIAAFAISLTISAILILVTIEINAIFKEAPYEGSVSDVTATGMIEFLYCLIPAMIILSVILFLGFAPMTEYYDCCCGKCHEWMNGLCRRLVEKEIEEIQSQKRNTSTNDVALKTSHVRTPSNSISECNEDG